MASRTINYKQLFDEARKKPHSTPEERQVVTALHMEKIKGLMNNKKVAQEMAKFYAYCVACLLNDANYNQALIAFKLMIKMVRYGNTIESEEI